MSRDKQRLADYLEHILEAIARIQRYTAALNEAAFLSDEMAQDAVIRNLEVIGEASRNIQRDYPDIATEHPDLPLSFAHEMRNALAHGYFQIDHELVWSTVQRDLPTLQSLTRDLRDSLPG